MVTTATRSGRTPRQNRKEARRCLSKTHPPLSALSLQPAFQIRNHGRRRCNRVRAALTNYEACRPSGRLSRAAGKAAPSFPMRHQRQQRGVYSNRRSARDESCGRLVPSPLRSNIYSDSVRFRPAMGTLHFYVAHPCRYPRRRPLL